MKPIDTFYFIRNNQVSADSDSLTSLYQPILGADAYRVYLYLVHFFDHGRAGHRFTEILNHVQLGFERLCQAIDRLGALGLLQFYQQDDHYLFKLNSPLDREGFLNNAVYRSLLTSAIGEPAVEALTMTIPSNLVNKTKRFSEVFTDRGDVYHQPKRADIDFDLHHFKQLMTRDGLRFADEKSDVIALYRLSESKRLTWFDLYQLAKVTASQGQISIGRLQAQLDNDQAPKTSQGDLTSEEAAAVRSAKNHSPEVFLGILKKSRQAVVTNQERQVLRDLAQMNFLDEVINMMVFRTLQRAKSANLNKNYLMKLANDFAYKKIKSAEQAMFYWKQSPLVKAAQTAPAKKTNVPSWSQQDYKTQASQEELAELEQIKQQMLARRGEEE